MISSERVTPLAVVPKASGAVRLFGDYSYTVNLTIIPENYPIPNIEDILYDSGCCKFFSKFAVREAYMHMLVNEETAKLHMVNTTRGFFEVNSLNYSIQSASAKWQRFVKNILSQ